MDSAPAMLEFLNAILSAVNEERIEEILDIQSEYPLIAQGVGMKYGRVDVLVRTCSNRIFDIEVQIDKDSMNNRSFFYGGRLISDEFKEGMSYSDMPKLRVINLVNFLMRKDNNEVIQPVILAYEKEPVRAATDIFRIINIQLPVFRKNYKTLESVSGNDFYTWLYMLDRGYQKEDEMEALSMMSEGLLAFAKQYNIAINDPDLVRMYRMEQDEKHEEASRLKKAEERGEKRGEKRGKEIGLRRGVEMANQQNAAKMKSKGYPVAEIAEITGLSPSQIAAL